MKRLMLSVALMAIAAGTTQAADPLVYVDDPIVEIDNFHDWTGFYIGVFGGYGTGTGTLTGSAPPALDGASDGSISGGLAGLAIGVNQQFDQFVLGVEGDIAWAGITGDVGAPCVAAVGQPCDQSVNWLGTVRARAGIALDPVLLYVTGGVAAAGLSSSIGNTGTTGSSTGVGYVVGLGAEVAFTEQVSAKIEYNYIDLGGGVTATPALPAGNSIHHDAQLHTFKVGANFHF